MVPAYSFGAEDSYRKKKKTLLLLGWYGVVLYRLDYRG